MNFKKFAIKLCLTLKVIMKKSINSSQLKTTLKWNINGELSSIDMTRIINALLVKELSEGEITCNKVNSDKKLKSWYVVVNSFYFQKEKRDKPSFR